MRARFHRSSASCARLERRSLGGLLRISRGLQWQGPFWFALAARVLAPRAVAAQCLPPQDEPCVPHHPLKESFVKASSGCNDTFSDEDPPPYPDGEVQAWTREHAAGALPFLLRVADGCDETTSAGGKALD